MIGLLVSASLGICQQVHAQVFPTVHVPFPGDSSGAQVNLGLNVAFNAAGFLVSLPGGGTGRFNYKYCYTVQMQDDVRLPTTIITDVQVENCLSALFVALQPEVIADGVAGVPHPEIWSIPTWSASNSQIIWSGPVGGPAFGTTWQFCFYSNIAPGVGTVRLRALRIEMDCSMNNPEITIPFFGPCNGPTTPPPCGIPTCDAGGPYTATKNVPVTFNGSGSTPGANASSLSYFWNFGDGTSGSGVSPSHIYTQAGTYTVKLTVTNNCGKSCLCTTTVTVTNPPQTVCPTPVCNAGGPYTTTVNTPITLNGSGSNGGGNGQTIASYFWNFGDGTNGSGVNPSKTYTAPGTYTVTLTVVNACGKFCSCTTTVTVRQPACVQPTCNAGGPYSGTVGSAVTFNGTGSLPGGSATITSYLWNFGDGATGSGIMTTHIYTAPGTYTVTLTVINDCGKQSSCTTTVSITPAPGNPADCQHNANVAQVYPALPTQSPYPFAQFGTFIGSSVAPFNQLAVPGVLALDTQQDNRLNVNSFVTSACCPGGSTTISDVRLVKRVPGSVKWPGCYQPYQVTQVGRDQIRTWWALNYTQPGTTFTLTLTGNCTTPGNPGNGGPRICPRHSPGGTWRNSCNCGSTNPPGSTPTPGGTTPYNETWVWTVVANPETFRLLIDLFHVPSIGESEVPCILDENVYDSLVSAADAIKAAVAAFKLNPSNANRQAATLALIQAEALIVANTIQADWLDDLNAIIPLPNSNFAPVGAGLADTCENPCSCKMLSDLEWIATQNGLIVQ